MKLLNLTITGFKKCSDDFNIIFTPTANKSKEDIEYELSEIDDNLYVFNTIGIAGKNASGKTTSIEALSIAYDILSNFKIQKAADYLRDSKDVIIKLYFYYNGYIYYYKARLIYNKSNDYIYFNDEEIYQTKYYKSYANDLYNLDRYEKLNIEKELPEDTSIVYYILKKIETRYFYYDSYIENALFLDKIADMYNTYNPNILKTIIELFDDNIMDIKLENKNKFIITFKNKKKEEKTRKELFNILSSGTIKGLYLYLSVILSLEDGKDLVIDEIEIHFHKTLVENLINLYKDKRINKHHATLIFTTHYCELLDLFNRYDNIYITRHEEKISITNAHKYNINNKLLKSKKFYDNAFGTAVSYESLVKFKKELLK